MLESMKENIPNIFSQLVAEYHESELPKPLSRDLDLPTLPAHVRKAVVLVGMRRSGKTWCLYQIIHTLLEDKVPREQTLYINFEDERLSGVTGEDLQYLFDALYAQYPELTESTLHLFFDEIHEIPGWEKFIRRLIERTSHAIYLTGSSAKLLSKEIATSLRGRTITREIFPFSFAEYANYLKLPSAAITTKQRAKMQQALQQYLVQGGFPETLSASKALQKELLQGYIETVTYRDIIERYDIKSPTPVRNLLRYCLQNAASLFAVNKYYQACRSQGVSVTKNALYDYMAHFEDAYCVFSVPMFAFSERKSAVNPKKIYPADPGLITAYSIKPDFEAGAQLETAVFLQLRRYHTHIFYYRTASQKEVDFLVQTPEGKMTLYQV